MPFHFINNFRFSIRVREKKIEDERKGDDEGDEEEESGEDDDFVDLLDIVDGRANIEDTEEGSQKDITRSSTSYKSHSESQTNDEIESSEEEGDEEDDDSEASENWEGKEMGDKVEGEGQKEKEGKGDQTHGASVFEAEERAVLPSDDEYSNPDAPEDLHAFVFGLETSSAQKRKALDGEGGDSTGKGNQGHRSKQRRVDFEERTEAGMESEFHVFSTGARKLNLDDLLAPLTSSSGSNPAMQSLKQSTKPLRSSASKIQTLSAPLPQRAKERLDREAAYEQTKEEVEKWSSTMRRIREAEHLSFPLQAEPEGRVSNLELAAKFKPTTELETSVDALLKSAKLREEDIPSTEDGMLADNKVSAEEIARRRAELRQMRELMFRAEIKARRVAMIKSKTYRKIKRKEKRKLGGDDELGMDEMDEEMRKEREVERAKERATLRHKHTGKWAKKMRAREGHGEEGTRDEVEEMLVKGERLRRKIGGLDSEGESEEKNDDEDEDEDEDGEVSLEKIKQDAFEEIKDRRKQ